METFKYTDLLPKLDAKKTGKMLVIKILFAVLCVFIHLFAGTLFTLN